MNREITSKRDWSNTKLHSSHRSSKSHRWPPRTSRQRRGACAYKPHAFLTMSLRRGHAYQLLWSLSRARGRPVAKKGQARSVPRPVTCLLLDWDFCRRLMQALSSPSENWLTMSTNSFSDSDLRDIREQFDQVSKYIRHYKAELGCGWLRVTLLVFRRNCGKVAIRPGCSVGS